MGNYKIHPHNECGICSKPKKYKEKTKNKETLKEQLPQRRPIRDDIMRRPEEEPGYGHGV